MSTGVDAVLGDAVFDLNLNEIDPTFKPVDPGMYQLKVIKLTPKTSTNGKAFLSGQFAIQNDAKFSGRRVFVSFFLSNGFAQKELRRLMDATGIIQTGSLKDWAEQISSEQPTFKAAVTIKQKQEKGPDGTYVGKVDQYGNPEVDNAIEFKDAQIA